MNDLASILAAPPPKSLAEARANWPDRRMEAIPRAYTSSPADWRDEVFYFLLPDRFSNGQEKPERLLKVDLSTQAGVALIRSLRGNAWRWDNWQASGNNRFQGGTLKGIQSKLPYLADLGATTIWVAPVFRQRVELNTYHGYGIHDFLDIDPRFGTRKDLVDLVDAAHAAGMKVILDIIFNHTGCNWLYDASAGNPYKPPYLPPPGSHSPTWPRSGYGTAITEPAPLLKDDDSVWPAELQIPSAYMRAGCGSLGAGDIDDDNAEHKRTDFEDLRKMNLFDGNVFQSLVLIYQYWIALADIDGYRIDTVKHVTLDQARNFCNALKEYAEELGKNDFFLVAEVAGGDSAEDRYLDIAGRNMNACLDIGQQRETICNVGKGLEPAANFFAGFDPYDRGMGSHRNWGSQHLVEATDHDNIWGSKLRLSVDASNDHQGAAVTAFQLFALGIPCLYYGTEQGLAGGAEPDQRGYLNGWGGQDCLLRETMFGPEHPRADGWLGTQGQLDQTIGFGPHGSAGWHVFNPDHPIYARIARMALVRKAFKALRRGRQYPRKISYLSFPFALPAPGQVVAWSRVFDDQEILVVVNVHGVARRGARVAVDGRLSAEGMRVVANTDPDAPPELRPGAKLGLDSWDGWSFVHLDDWLLGPSEVLVLANRPAVESAGMKWS
jgi:glycosidase